MDDFEENTSEKFNEWCNKYPYTFMISINKVWEWVKRHKKNKSVWEYDNSVTDCNCIATYNSPPYCLHFNKLIKKQVKS